MAVNGTLLIVGAAESMQVSLCSWGAVGQGLVFRDVDRLAGHARVQPADRRALDERNLPVRARLAKPMTA